MTGRGLHSMPYVYEILIRNQDGSWSHGWQALWLYFEKHQPGCVCPCSVNVG